MKGLAFSLLLLCLAVPAAAQAARTFYVDATRGDDGRDGATPATCWRTLAKVNAAPLEPGDRVLFARGQSWRGQLVPHSGAAGAPITYGAFGDGAKPVLLGSASADKPEDWRPAGDGIWATAPATYEPVGAAVALSARPWTLHTEAGAAATLQTGEAGAVLRIAGTSAGTAQNHIQLMCSGLSLEAGAYYILTFRASASRPVTPAAISLLKNGPPYTGYAMRSSGLPTIGDTEAEYTVRFQSTQTADDARLTVYLGGTLTADTTLTLRPGTLQKARCSQTIPLSVDVGNIIFDGGKVTGFKKWSVADLRADGDFFYDAERWQVFLRSDAHPAQRWKSVELALRRHIVDQGNRGYVTYEDLDLRYGAAHGFGGGSTHHITIRACDISYIGGGHQFTRPDGKPVRFGNGVEFWADARDCLVEDCRIWEIYDAALTNQGTGVNVQENITYRRNVIWNSEYSFEFWNRGPESKTRNIVFEHNTCVDAGRGWGYRQRPDPNGRHLMFYDNSSATTGVIVRYNIFCNAADSLLRLQGRDWTAALAMDNNVWWQESGPLLLWDKEKVDDAGFAAFLKPRGLDAHSVIADPKFVNAAARDYRLAPDSPARRLSNGGMPAGALR